MNAATLAAIAEPTRFAIVELLRDGRRPSVSEIAEAVGCRQPQATKHLRVLRDAGIVRADRDANRVLHRLRPEPFAEVAAWASSFEALWDARLDALGEYLEGDGTPSTDTTD